MTSATGAGNRRAGYRKGALQTVGFGSVRGALVIGVAMLVCSSTSAGERAWWQAPGGEDSLCLDISTRSDPAVVGAEIAVARAYSDYLSVRIGFELLSAETPRYLVGGATAGAHLTLPWRLAPFVGVGGFVGWWDAQVPEANLVDDDSRGRVAATGDTQPIILDGVIVLYPEVGLHLWLTDSLRLTLSSRYHVTTAGRAHDAWLANVGLSFFVSP